MKSDERMPYFATLWPSAESLCNAILDGPSWQGLRVLDLGCGIGAVGLAAAFRQARVSLLDWEPRAIEIARFSAKALGLGLEFALAGDWRDEDLALPKFDRILGADVLYEDRNVPAVAQFLQRFLKPSGQAWIADPGRQCAAAFPQALQALGLQSSPGPELPPSNDLPVHLVKVTWTKS